MHQKAGECAASQKRGMLPFTTPATTPAPPPLKQGLGGWEDLRGEVRPIHVSHEPRSKNTYHERHSMRQFYHIRCGRCRQVNASKGRRMRSQSKTWHAAIHNACHHTRTPPMFQQANMENWQNAEETLRSQIAAVKKNHQYNKKNQQEHWQQHHKTV